MGHPPRAFEGLLNGQNVVQSIKEGFNRNVDRSTPGQLTTLGGTTDITTTKVKGFVQETSNGSKSISAIPGIGQTGDLTVHAPGEKPGKVEVTVPVGPLASVGISNNSATLSVGAVASLPVPRVKDGLNVGVDAPAAKSAASSAASVVSDTVKGFFVSPPPTPKPPPPPACSAQGQC